MNIVYLPDAREVHAEIEFEPAKWERALRYNRQPEGYRLGQ